MKLIKINLVLLILIGLIDQCAAVPRARHNYFKEDLLIVLSLAFIYLTRCKPKKRRSIWVNPYLQERREKGRFMKDFVDLRTNVSLFKENYHMLPAQFDFLVELLKPIMVPIINRRPVDFISCEEKLSLTLEYLASGTIQRHLGSIYRISKQHVGPIIDDTCTHLITILSGICLKELEKKEWVNISNRFNLKWNFPNCLGAIYGKHVAIKAPPNAASLFYNFKGFHSIVLMAVCDADYRFLYYDVGAYGSEGDSTVFSKCEFGKRLLKEDIDIPLESSVFGKKIPFTFVADEAFGMHQNIMTPYGLSKKKRELSNEESIFNYRLSRARRCIENAFGIMCARWMCLSRTIFMNPTRAQKVVGACCLLHNFLMKECGNEYCPPGFADFFDEDGVLCDGNWRLSSHKPLTNIDRVNGRRGRRQSQAETTRDHLKNYFNSNEGRLSWQDKHC